MNDLVSMIIFQKTNSTFSTFIMNMKPVIRKNHAFQNRIN